MNQAAVNVDKKATVKEISLMERFARRFNLEPTNMMSALKATAFKQRNGEVTNEQLMALVLVADQYGLNPFTKEIYAYPDKAGIVPVVGVDGWSRIINGNNRMDGIEFEYSPETINHKGHTCHEWIDCLIYRKDRSRPAKVREYFSEVCRNANFPTPWDSHPNRMHRHKTLIQCSRIAFGFVGIYDQDEAERILEAPLDTDDMPDRAQHTQAQKEYFDQLIKEKNAAGMFLFMQNLRETGIDNSLYNSFEKGKITASKKVVNGLESKGAQILNESVHSIDEMVISDDRHGILEIVEGMNKDEIGFILEFCATESAVVIEEIMK